VCHSAAICFAFDCSSSYCSIDEIPSFELCSAIVPVVCFGPYTLPSSTPIDRDALPNSWPCVATFARFDWYRVSSFE